MSEQQNKPSWRDGLTMEQVNAVNAAAQALYATQHPDGQPWRDRGQNTKDTYSGIALAVLRAASPDDWPTPKPKTRGEEVAERMVQFGIGEDDEVLRILPHDADRPAPTLPLRHWWDGMKATGYGPTLRGYIAHAIDAERAAAVKEYVDSLPPPEDDPFDCQEFYDLMRTYRNAGPSTAGQRYAAVQKYCRRAVFGLKGAK